MHECLVEKRSFIKRYTAIFSRLAVEDEIRGDDGTANDGGAIEEPLGHAAGVGAHKLAARLDVGATEGLLEGISRVGECRDGCNRLGRES